VNKSQKKKSRDLGVKIKKDKNSTSRLSLENSTCVVNTSAKKGNNVIEKVSVVKAKDKQAVSIIINYKGGKKVINNSKEVFNMFNNNKDKDYKKSNKNKNIISKNRGGLGVGKVNSSNNKKGPSKVNVNKSNNKDYTKANNNSKKVSTVKGNKNIGGKESRQETENNKSNNKSKSVTNNNKIQII
jgi:hypothetical protein